MIFGKSQKKKNFKNSLFDQIRHNFYKSMFCSSVPSPVLRPIFIRKLYEREDDANAWIFDGSSMNRDASDEVRRTREKNASKKDAPSVSECKSNSEHLAHFFLCATYYIGL